MPYLLSYFPPTSLFLISIFLKCFLHCCRFAQHALSVGRDQWRLCFRLHAPHPPHGAQSRGRSHSTARWRLGARKEFSVCIWIAALSLTESCCSFPFPHQPKRSSWCTGHPSSASWSWTVTALPSLSLWKWPTTWRARPTCRAHITSWWCQRSSSRWVHGAAQEAGWLCRWAASSHI